MKTIEENLRKEAINRAKKTAKEIFEYNHTKAINSNAEKLSGERIIKNIQNRMDSRGHIRIGHFISILIDEVVERIQGKCFEKVQDEFYRKVMEQ